LYSSDRLRLVRHQHYLRQKLQPQKLQPQLLQPQSYATPSRYRTISTKTSWPTLYQKIAFTLLASLGGWHTSL